jgi:hypothetical protein
MSLEDINILMPSKFLLHSPTTRYHIPQQLTTTAVSGDLRNTIVTVNSLPSGYTKTCDLTLNDPNPIIVIRNAFILMIIFLYPDKHEATKMILHLWYSAFLCFKDFKKLRYELLPFIERAYAKNKNGKATSQVSQRWTKGSASLRLTLTRRQWKMMLVMLEKGDELDYHMAELSRRGVLDKDKLARNKILLDVPSVHRRSHMKFLATGMLLPFGQPVGKYDMPNP